MVSYSLQRNLAASLIGSGESAGVPVNCSALETSLSLIVGCGGRWEGLSACFVAVGTHARSYSYLRCLISQEEMNLSKSSHET